MPTFTDPQDVCNFFFQDTLEDFEGEVFVCLKLLEYMSEYSTEGNVNLRFGLITKKTDLMTFGNLTPKGWSFPKTYLFLFLLFGNLEIQDDVEVVFHMDEYRKYNLNLTEEEKPLIENLLENEGKGGFSDFSYISLSEKVLEFIEIKNNFDSIENIKKVEDMLLSYIDEFQEGVVSKKFDLLPPEKQRNLILNKLSDYHTLVGHHFSIRESQFKQYERVSFILVVVLLWELGYVDIWSFHSIDDYPIRDKDGKYLHEKEDPNFNIFIRQKTITLFEGLFEMKNIILDKIFDEEYKKISILRKGGSLFMLEGEKEIDGDEIRFVELQKQYPHSEIKAKNYNGKTTKYEVKEKIKLDKTGQE